MNLSVIARIFYTGYVYFGGIRGTVINWGYQEPGVAMFIYAVGICVAYLVQRWALIRAFRASGLYSRIETILGI